MQSDRARSGSSPKAELGYRQAGMVGEHLTVACPMVKAKGHIVQVIGPDGKTTKTLYRYRK